MKRLSKNLWRLSLALPCMMLAMGCEGNDAAETENNEPIELRISPTVAATRSVIQGGTQSGTGTNVMQNVVVYATGDDYTAQKNNNYAIYTQKDDGSGWENNGIPKIYLTNAEATIYAYYPAYKIKDDGSMDTEAIGIGSDPFSTSSTISISTLASGTITATDNADMVWNNTSGSWTNNTDAKKATIAAAPGETDYMYAESKKASNQNSSNSIELTMKHALSMISFRVYNDKTYQGTGTLSEIKLEDVSNTAVLYSSAKMNVSSGEISSASTTATYTRTITGYTLAQEGRDNANSADEAKAAAKKISIMVLPVSNYSTNSVKASFKIDNATYTVNLSSPTNDNKWEAGKNYLYTVLLNGKQLTISKVEVTPWSEVAVNNDLTIQ